MTQFKRYGIIRNINAAGVNEMYLSTYAEAKALQKYYEACGAKNLEIFVALMGDVAQPEEIIGGPEASADKLPWTITVRGATLRSNVADAIAVLKAGQPNIVQTTQRVLSDIGLLWGFIDGPDWRFQADVAAHQAQMQACGL
jgi:hypothetical protein